MSLDLKPLVEFFQCDGETIILALRERFEKNVKIFSMVTDFEFRYLNLEIDEVEAF